MGIVFHTLLEVTEPAENRAERTESSMQDQDLPVSEGPELLNSILLEGVYTSCAAPHVNRKL